MTLKLKLKYYIIIIVLKFILKFLDILICGDCWLCPCVRLLHQKWCTELLFGVHYKIYLFPHIVIFNIACDWALYQELFRPRLVLSAKWSRGVSWFQYLFCICSHMTKNRPVECCGAICASITEKTAANFIYFLIIKVKLWNNFTVWEIMPHNISEPISLQEI